MVGVIIASHGSFATGIKESSQMIFGPQPDVEAVVLTPDMGPDDFKKKLQAAIDALESSEQILFLTDLWGGTPFNQINLLIEEHGGEDWVAITGMNLPMLIEVLASRMAADTAKEIVQAVKPEAKAGIRILPASCDVDDAPVAVAAAAAPVAAIPEGTVLGDGKIDFAFVRVDTRLLHGQVATSITKSVNPDRILVVSDEVSKDELRKNLIVEAAPPGVKAHVIPVDKLIQVAKDPRFGDTRAMVLFENPQDLERVINAGVDIKEVNIGSIAHSVGKVVVTKAVAMGPEDVKTFEALHDKGVKFDIRKVPSESAESYENVMAKAKAGLADMKNS